MNYVNDAQNRNLESNRGVSITFVVLSFGKDYRDFAGRLISSIQQFVHVNCQVIVFTDVPEYFAGLTQTANVQIDSVKCENLVWPEATLDRYRLISSNAMRLLGEYCFYIDADSIIGDSFTLIQDFENQPFFAVVEHPGYYERGLAFYFYKRFVNPSWETSRQSKARVQWWRRRKYVCGGFWGGSRDRFLEVADLLYRNTNHDLAKLFYPRSYDESYLNQYYSASIDVTLLKPKYGFSPKFNSKSLTIERPVVIFLEKNDELIQRKIVNDKN
jgi:histo-blood group ABO system transferase